MVFALLFIGSISTVVHGVASIGLLYTLATATSEFIGLTLGSGLDRLAVLFVLSIWAIYHVVAPVDLK